ncbi:MAG: hypothetical protein LUI05_00125 [Oscillospiraceae bacterium]|nr:hypothetical protein [Oscillospiraceae bacterium]
MNYETPTGSGRGFRGYSDLAVILAATPRRLSNTSYFKGVFIMCGFNFGNGSSCCWIIIILLVLFFCCGNNSCDNDCNNNCGCNMC